MTEYHQPYSEIKKMPIKLLTFLYELAIAKNQYLKDKSEERKAQLQNRIRIPRKPL